MSDELLNILSDNNSDIDNEKLMDYISDKLPPDEKFDFEKKMADSEMLNDIVEGLEKFKNKKDVAALVDQLNHNLKKQLAKKKEKKLKRTIKNFPWMYLAIILILIFMLISFLAVKKHLENEQTPVSQPKKEIGIVSNKKPILSNGSFLSRKSYFLIFINNFYN